MDYWLDGYNYIMRRGWCENGKPLEEARGRLIQSVRCLGVPVRVFFDAAKVPPGQVVQSSATERVDVEFARGMSADDAIVEALRSVDAKGVTVVTDDRELRMRCRQVGANTVGVDKFMQHVDRTSGRAETSRDGKSAPGKGGAAERPNAVSRRNVDDWLDYMGLDEDFKLDDDESPA